MSYDVDEYDDDYSDDDQSEVEPCPHCGAMIYEDSEACPACGQYVVFRHRAINGLPRWVVVIALLGMAAFVLSVLRWPW